VNPTPPVELQPRVRAALEEACLAVFRQPLSNTLDVLQWRDLLRGFAAHYQRLANLRRRDRRSLVRRTKHPLSALALLLALGHGPAWAATIAVAPETPPPIKADGKCSLVEAIVNANANARRHADCAAGSGAVDRIVLPANSRQLLTPSTPALPVITSRIVLEGNGSTILRQIQNGLYVGDSFISIAAGGDLTLNRTTISGEGSVGTTDRGDGITNRGRLALNDSHVTGLLATGVVNEGGTAVIKDSSLTGNGGYKDGGGINNNSRGMVTVANSVISGNSGYFGGGGVHNGYNSSMTLTDTLVAGNRISYEGAGGGIENRGTLTLVRTIVTGNRSQAGGGIANAATGTAMIRRSTISGNWVEEQYAYQPGGGIANLGKLTLANSTVSGNTAPAFGAGIWSGQSSVVRVESSTITGNILEADSPYYLGQGGGIDFVGGTLTLQRTIVSGNTGQDGREVFVDSGAVVHANDFNLFGHDGDAGVAGFTPGSTDIVPNVSLGGILLPLAHNGGGADMSTHALAIGSPALDAAPTDGKCFQVDQRGNPRPRGARCDIGAFEGSAVRCNGLVTTMVGTDGPDELIGTPGPDVIAGLNGKDDIRGLAGNDTICGGAGADNLFGGGGHDKLFGQGGNDHLVGHGGNDTLNGGPGQDRCDGGANSDTATACEVVNGVP
jgi:hypothetical protein